MQCRVLTIIQDNAFNFNIKLNWYGFPSSTTLADQYILDSFLYARGDMPSHLRKMRLK